VQEDGEAPINTKEWRINTNKFKNAVDAKDIILRQPRFLSNQCQASSLRASLVLFAAQQK
jgi:hypothetical protein